MSIKIPVEVRQGSAPELVAQRIEAPVIRLTTLVSFLTPEGRATEEELAIFDTGAPFSLLPRDLTELLI